MEQQNRKYAHEDIDRIFKELLPQNGLAVRDAQVELANLLTYIKQLAAAKQRFATEHEEVYRAAQDVLNKHLFADIILKWKKYVESEVSESTFVGYNLLANIIEEHYRVENLYIEDMSSEDVDLYLHMLKDGGRKTETVKRYKTVISSVVHYAISELKLIKHDFMADTKKLKIPRNEKFSGDYYNEKELTFLLEKITHDKLEFPVWFGGFYGMRLGEDMGMRWSQIDFDNNIFYINYVITRALVDGKVVEIGVPRAKTEESLRAHQLIEPLKIKLLRRKEEIENHRQLYGNAYNNEYLDFVCVDDLGNRLKLDYVSWAYPAFLKRIGLRKIRFHDLRHTSASLLLKAGMQLTDVMNWLGHKNFRTTQRYSHLEARSKETSTKALQTLIFD